MTEWNSSNVLVSFEYFFQVVFTTKDITWEGISKNYCNRPFVCGVYSSWQTNYYITITLGGK